MLKENRNSTKLINKWIYTSIIFIFLLGAVLHFAYEFSGKNVIVGIFVPINESIWEHLKLSFYPIIFSWVLFYILFNNKLKIEFDVLMVSMISSAVISVIVIVSFYYSYTGALGIESLVMDILSLLVAIFISQLVAKHIYTYSKPNNITLYTSLILLLLFIIMFTVFTFNPPRLPLFVDPVTGNYGI